MASTPPIVSVVLPTYNRVNLIMESIESVLSQTLTDYEIIVIDDGSTDGTRELVQPLIESDTIRYIYQQNAGLSAARNHGIQLSKGKYIAFLDSDDLFMPTKLEKQVHVLDNDREAAFVHSGYHKFDNEGNNLGYRDSSTISGWVYPQILLDWNVLIAVPCVMVRTEIIREVGGFDESMDWAEDLDLWRRIARNYPIRMVPESLSMIRTHMGSISSDKTKAADAFFQYLTNAFEDDPSLGKIFQRRAFAKMFTNVGHNLLGNGGKEQMKLVRQHSLEAIRSWPFEFGAYAGFFASFVNPDLRNRLVNIWRRWRYRLPKE